VSRELQLEHDAVHGDRDVPALSYHDTTLGSRRYVVELTGLGSEMESHRWSIESFRVPPEVAW
jgi:hypothetical protein